MAGYMSAIDHLKLTHRLTAREVFIYDPFGGNCPDILKAIKILEDNIEWRKNDLNPGSGSYAGHVARIKILEKKLKKLKKAYKDICGQACFTEVSSV